MRQRRHAAGPGDRFDDTRDVWAAPRNERGPIVAEQAVERVTTIDGVTSRDERIGDERATDASPAGRGRGREERVEVDGAVERLQAARDFPHPLDAGGALDSRKRARFDVRRVEEVAEHVDVSPAIDGRDLDAVDQPEAMRVRRLTRLGQPGHRVVIGDAHDAEPDVGRERDERQRSQPAVGSCGVEMEINHGASGAWRGAGSCAWGGRLAADAGVPRAAGIRG